MALPEYRGRTFPNPYAGTEHLQPTGKFISIHNERAIQLHHALDQAFSSVYPDDGDNTSLIAMRNALGEYRFPIHMSHSETGRTHQGTTLQVSPLGLIRAVQAVAHENTAVANTLVQTMKDVLTHESVEQANDLQRMLKAYYDLIEHGDHAIPAGQRIERITSFGSLSEQYLTSLESIWQLYADAQNIPGPVAKLVPTNFNVTDRTYFDNVGRVLESLHMRGVANEYDTTRPMPALSPTTPVLPQSTDDLSTLLKDAEFWKMLGNS
jgi:hypothetical protein